MEWLFVWLIVASLFGWWGSALSNSKARGRTVGFLLGFLLGILIVALLSANQPVNQVTLSESEEARRAERSRFGRRARSPRAAVRSSSPPRSSVRSTAPPRNSRPDADADEPIRCPTCDEESTAEARFCAACGAAIPGGPDR